VLKSRTDEGGKTPGTHRMHGMYIAVMVHRAQQRKHRIRSTWISEIIRRQLKTELGRVSELVKNETHLSVELTHEKLPFMNDAEVRDGIACDGM
jgi:hypothetical protein